MKFSISFSVLPSETDELCLISVFSALAMQDKDIHPLSRAVFIEDERWQI